MSKLSEVLKLKPSPGGYELGCSLPFDVHSLTERVFLYTKMDVKPYKFEESLSVSLYNTNKSSLDKIVGNNPELRFQADIEFNNFLIMIRKKIYKIEYYLKSDPTEPKIIKANTPNFIFCFIIFQDGSCKIEMSLLHKVSREYKPDFLKSKARGEIGFVYFLKSEYGIKIGCTNKLKRRLNVFGVKLPFKTELHSFVVCKDCNKLESFLHENLKHKRINGEWFDLVEEDFLEIDKILKNMKLSRLFDSTPFYG